MPPSWRRPPVPLEGNMAGPRGTRGTVEAGPEFAARLPVVVVPRYSSSLDGSTNTAAVHRGTLLVPRWMPASRSAPKKASPADRAALLPLLRAHQEALAALEKSTDLVDAQRLERLSRTFAALMAQLQAMARLQVHRVELSPKTVGHLLPAGHPCPGGAELAEMPEGLRELQGEMEELTVQSSRLAAVPEWVGDLTRLTTLELCSSSDRVKELPSSLSKLTALKSLALTALNVCRLWNVGTLHALTRLVVDSCSNLNELPKSFGTLVALKTLEIKTCGSLEKLPVSLCSLPSLESLMVSNCRGLKELPAQLGNLTTVKRLELARIELLKKLPDTLGNMAGLKELIVDGCSGLTALPDGLGALTRLRTLYLYNLPDLNELPQSVGRLSSLVELRIEWCGSLHVLPRRGNFRALQKLRLERVMIHTLSTSVLSGLTSLVTLDIFDCLRLLGLPENFGTLVALESLRLRECPQVTELPASVENLTRLTELECTNCPLEDFPCIDALSALHTLKVVVSWYHNGEGCDVFRTLARSLPCLRLLQTLRLGSLKEPEYVMSSDDEDEEDDEPDLSDEDVLALGLSLRAWPPPLLKRIEADDVGYHEPMSLSNFWRELGLPQTAGYMSIGQTLDFFREQQCKVLAFAGGMHGRLGAASCVSWLDEQMLLMIADEVLGGWSLHKKWEQERRSAAAGGPSAS